MDGRVAKAAIALRYAATDPWDRLVAEQPVDSKHGRADAKIVAQVMGLGKKVFVALGGTAAAATLTVDSYKLRCPSK